MKHSERSLQNSVWPSPVGLSRPIPADSPHHSLQHWPSFSVPDFRALCVLFPFPVMLVPPPPSLGLMDSYSSFMLLLKCLQLRPLQPCQTKSDCSVKYSHNSLYLLGAHHNCWFHIFWSYSVQGFSPCTLRGESCIETGAYIVGTQNCRVNEGRFLPFLYVGFFLLLCKAFCGLHYHLLNTLQPAIYFTLQLPDLCCILSTSRNFSNKSPRG